MSDLTIDHLEDSVADTLTDEDITTTTSAVPAGSLADPDGTDGDADGEDTGGDNAPAGDTVTEGDGPGDAD